MLDNQMGTLKRDNMVQYLKNIGYTFGRFDGKYIYYVCDNGHSVSIGITSFPNRKGSISKGKNFTMCNQCDNDIRNEQNRKDLAEKVPHHYVLKYADGGHDIDYICGNCGSECHSNKPSLLRGSKHCLSCQNDSRRLNQDDVAKIIAEYGLIFQDGFVYKNNKHLNVICMCDNEYTTSLHDIRRGRLCAKCAPERREETCLAIYGVANPFQSEMVKEKIMKTNRQNLGVDYPQQNPNVQKKREETCMKRHGSKYVFTQEWVRRRGRETMLRKYGSECFLWTREFREKMIDLYGTIYITRTDRYKEIMIEICGAPSYVESDKYKHIILERYGVKNYIESKDFEKKMLERWGVVHALQCPELFHRWLKSCYRVKDFTLPKTKRVVRFMGYEDIAILRILGCENMFLNRNITEDEIFTDEDVPSFDYRDDDGKFHKYYPDIYIKDTKIIYEVKSTYTFGLAPRMNYLKFKQVSRDGYKMIVLIFSDRKTLASEWVFDGDNEIVVTGEPIPVFDESKSDI